MADGSSLIRVVCPVPAAADVEAFGALHAFLDSGTSEKLILRTGGRTFTMRRRREELAELSRG